MRHTMPRAQLAVKSVEIAKTIADPIKREACAAAAFGLAYKYLSKSEAKSILEAIKVFDFVDWIVEDSMLEANKKTAREMLRHGETITRIIRYTKLDEEVIRQLQAEPENDLADIAV